MLKYLYLVHFDLFYVMFILITTDGGMNPDSDESVLTSEYHWSAGGHNGLYYEIMAGTPCYITA